MSRKYKQRGYNEEERSSRSERARRVDREGPSGRGLGKPTASVFRCRRCAGLVEVEGTAALPAHCPSCGGDLHTCTHCAYFDTSAPFECREEIPERIAKKATNNECALFRIKWTQEFAKDAESRSDAAKAFDDLFNF